MTDPQFRLLHAGDLALDVPLSGLSQIPAGLRQTLIDAPFTAAERVFDVAIQEQVAAVFLVGAVGDPRVPTARSLAFVREQFDRLSGAGIPLFWSCSVGERTAQWLRATRLPDSIHVFLGPRVEEVLYTSPAGWVLRVLGRGGPGTAVRGTDFRVDSDGPYCVVLTSGHAEGPALSTVPVDYWALGGCADRKTLFTEPHVAHYPGTPQGRNPNAIGPHGCTLLEVRPSQTSRLRFIPCDRVRWHHERVIASSGMSWEELSNLLARRISELRSQTPAGPLLVRWTLVAGDLSKGPGGLRSLAERAYRWMCTEQERAEEPCWPVSVEEEVPDRVSAGMYDEDTLLGDYLREVRRLGEDTSAPLLDASDADLVVESDLSWLVQSPDSAERTRVLRDVAELGSGLLRGENVI
jgi:DNA repair protein SbcD/Mre11